MNNIKKSLLNKGQNGFTLVELLVALFIFGLISSAAVMLLRSASQSQIQLKDKLSKQGSISRLSNLMETDLAQALARPVRNDSGTMMAAFLAQNNNGNNDGMLFAFTRTGLGMMGADIGPDNSKDDYIAQSAIGRVEYGIENRKLIRTSTLFADGAAKEEPAILLEDVDQMTIKYRDDKGQWRDDWSADDIMAMPRAIEINIAQKNAPPLRFIFLVGSQNRPILQEDENKEEGANIDENDIAQEDENGG